MDDQKLKDQQRETADDMLIEGAFKEVLDIYLASPHRRKGDIINKAFNFARQAHTSPDCCCLFNSYFLACAYAAAANLVELLKLFNGSAVALGNLR